MISRVLVPLDGSPEAEQALPYARALLPTGGAILLFQAVPEFEMPGANEPALTELNWALKPAPDANGKTRLEVAQAALTQIATRVSDDQVSCSTEVAQGDPASEILQAIAQRDVDVVAMTTHGRGAVGRTVFGSVADRIVRTSPVPVVLVRPWLEPAVPESASITRLLVPLDGSDLAEEALPIATELAQRLKVPVHLVRATNTAAVLASLTGGSFFPVNPPQSMYDQMIADLEGSARSYLTSVATRLQEQGLDVSWAVLDGSPYADIANAAQPDDLIIITSHGRGGVMRWLLGSVAEKLVREAPAPVLLVPAANRGSHQHVPGA